MRKTHEECINSAGAVRICMYMYGDTRVIIVAHATIWKMLLWHILFMATTWI